MLVNCEYCGDEIEKRVGHVTRAIKDGMHLFCDKICSGLSRRINRSIEERKAIKQQYDKEFRVKNKERLKAEKASHFKNTYDSAKAAIVRKKRAPYHAEYCRQPEYRKWKKGYDEQYRAKKLYGEDWESGILLKNILSEIDNRETKQLQGLTNKTQKRKRSWKNKQSSQLPR